MSWDRYASSSADLAGAVSLRIRARQLARSTVLSVVGSTLPAPSGPFLRCLYCHWVFPDTTAHFERLLTMLQRVGQFVTTERCVDIVSGDVPLDGRYFHLSFDDGFKNNLLCAAPVLTRLGIPAAVFAPSAFIGASFEEASRYCRDITNYRAPIEMLTWDDCRELLALGIDVGSHTRTHARLSGISAAASNLDSEIVGSKKEIEDRLGVECKYFSWPYGTRQDVDQRSLDAVKRAGYRACFGAYRAPLPPGRTNGFSIPRHHFESTWPSTHVRAFASGFGEWRA